MRALVSFGIGVHAALDEREPDRLSLDVIAVLAVVEQRHTVIPLGEVGPFVRACLEAGPVPRRVPVRRALHVAPLDVERRARRVDRDRESGFEQRLMLVPVDVGGEVDARHVTVEQDALRDHALSIMTDDFHAAAQRPVLDDLPRGHVVDGVRLVLIVDVDVPGVEIERAIFEGDQPITALAGDNDLTPRLLVVERHDLGILVEL